MFSLDLPNSSYPCSLEIKAFKILNMGKPVTVHFNFNNAHCQDVINSSFNITEKPIMNTRRKKIGTTIYK